MSLNTFLQKIQNKQEISFDETISIITESYHYTASEFSNGLDDDKLINATGTNEGSCKIFAFAQMNKLTQQQTLNLFGDYYRKDVLQDPDGSGHQNIRNFMQFGWQGIHFSQQVLSAK